MSTFKRIIESKPGSNYILQGNAAFALGVVHAGYHAADGYPGTPSTEVIDKSLAFAQDRMTVGWSVNEAVAMGVAVGHAVAGFDTVVTMKIPGVFQAGDVISTSAFYTSESGALVIFAATDYVPSSTQHVVDARYFFSSCRIPVLEPRNHQEMYEIAWSAADISRNYNTPVVVLASGILTHSEGLVSTREPRTITPRSLPENLNAWMLMPGIARKNYNTATTERIPAIQKWTESSGLVTQITGSDKFGIIVNGEAEIIVKESMESVGANPSILSLSVAYPLPIETIRKFAEDIDGPVFMVEDGGRFIQEQLTIKGIDVVGKDEQSTITNWTPVDVLQLLARYGETGISPQKESEKIAVEPLNRPPTICPGCPYRAFGLTVATLKRKKKLFASFGDIGCSTLLYFLNALDTVLCMGASDAMRQGFVLSRPEMANRVISVLGDSCECHSGLDATRNAVFRNTPGVKVILDNSITAMTGGQPAPSSKSNLAGVPNKFVLKEAVAAEKSRTVTVDAYKIKDVESALTDALDLAEKGEFSTLILEGPCINETESKKKVRQLRINRELCKQCGLCGICPGIQHDEERKPHFTILCTNCGSNTQVCRQRCPFGAIEVVEEEKKSPRPAGEIPALDTIKEVAVNSDQLPDSLRVAIRGIGGQGNLFFGKVLAEMALRTPYVEANIVKGDTHGMAQLGGPVISVFSCGDVFSPVLAPHSADVLVAMEVGEILRPGFLELLKPGGTILFNHFIAVPPTAKKEDYPDYDKIREILEKNKYDIITIDAYETARELGDKSGRTANVIMLGLLSTIEPFSRIPVENWLAALMAVSPTDKIKGMNQQAFNGARNMRH
jgi:indolepyruvate ferredoxin oxidoreductase, alpha subunit